MVIIFGFCDILYGLAGSDCQEVFLSVAAREQHSELDPFGSKKLSIPTCFCSHGVQNSSAVIACFLQSLHARFVRAISCCASTVRQFSDVQCSTLP